MGTEITVFTAEKMQEIVDAAIVDAEVLTDDLVLHRHDGATIDVGNVRGPKGDTGAPGPPGEPGSGGGGGGGPWPVKQVYANYTLVLDDAFTRVEGISAGSQTLLVPLEEDVPFEEGTIVEFCQMDNGLWTIGGAEGVTLLAYASALTSGGKYAECQLRKRSGDEWFVWGMLQPAPEGGG